MPRRRPRRRVALKPRPVPATAVNHVWAYDFVTTELKCLTVVDEWTRESLAMTWPAAFGPGALSNAARDPSPNPSDNGPEFVAGAILRWLLQAHRNRAEPWQNATDESFNGKFRDEYLSLQWFRNRVDAKVGIEQWRRHYNDVPRALAITPAEFKAQLAGSDNGGRSPAMPAHAEKNTRAT